MITIGLDMMGGDFAPQEAVKGAAAYFNEGKENVHLVMIGKEEAECFLYEVFCRHMITIQYHDECPGGLRKCCVEIPSFCVLVFFTSQIGGAELGRQPAYLVGSVLGCCGAQRIRLSQHAGSATVVEYINAQLVGGITHLSGCNQR